MSLLKGISSRPASTLTPPPSPTTTTTDHTISSDSSANVVRPEPTLVPRARSQPGALKELLLITVLFVAYKLGRLVAIGHVTRAHDDADLVWSLERLLHLPDESSVQRLLLNSETVTRLANMYYAYVHFPATAVFLIWLYLYKREFYVWIRRTLVWLTGLSLVIHILFPLTPPRMFPTSGMIDTAALLGPTVYGSPESDHLSNQYAAMPSLHVGWAAIVAIGLIVATRSRWRWLWLAHPVITLIVVVGTANHYWLDAIVVLAILVGVLLLPWRLGSVRTPRTGSPAT